MAIRTPIIAGAMLRARRCWAVSILVASVLVQLYHGSSCVMRRAAMLEDSCTIDN